MQMPPTTAAANPPPATAARARAGDLVGLALLVAFWSVLASGVAPTLWQTWQTDDSLSHAPLVPVIAGLLLWSRRGDLTTWRSADARGLAALVACAVLYVLGSWADFAAVRQVSLVAMAAAAVWFLGGVRALLAASSGLGFLLFVIPWPTTLTERLTFPMQLFSSSYAALLAGLLGIPVVQQGVELAVVPRPGAAPVYQVLVAQKCSGLTSLMVLLALGYLVACLTPLRWGWRALLVATVVPLALAGNAVRLAAVLAAGAYHSPGLAQTVHDNEQPVLVMLCTVGLMALRYGLITWTRPRQTPEGTRGQGSEDGGAVPILGS